MSGIEKGFHEVLSRAQKSCLDLENFPDYFRFKKEEALLVAEKTGIADNGIVLEIGCGTGFQSLLLASCCKKVVATDLPDFSESTHTPGVKKAEELAVRCGIRNIEHLGCSAAALPFKDKTFDCVFLSGVLEHIADKDAALRETRRVLKDDGAVVCCVPTYMESIFQFPALYLYLCKRAFDVARDKLAGKKASRGSIFFDKKSDDAGRSGGDFVKAFLRNNPSFPLPEPHGDWRNKKGKQSIFVEFRRQLPWNWKAMFTKNGFRVRGWFAVLFIPYRIIEIFSPRMVPRLYCGSRWLRGKIAGSFLKYFSVSVCYVAEKE